MNLGNVNVLSDIHETYFKQGLPLLPIGFPNGWMSATDLRLLYNVARNVSGPVLEIGPWLGRSTSAIAAGLRDRQDLGADPVCFDTIDFGITSAQEWTEKFGEKFSLTKDKGRVAEAVYHPGGTLAVLIRNIKDNGLLPYVTNIIRGDFIQCPIKRSCNMIFCDATHDDDEINRHLPYISELAGPGCTLVFDDVITEQRAELICDFLNTKRYFMTRKEFPNKRRCKVMLVETN